VLRKPITSDLKPAAAVDERWRQTAPSGQRQNTLHVAAERVAGLVFADGRKCKNGPSARIRQNHAELPSGFLDTIVDTVEIGEVARIHLNTHGAGADLLRRRIIRW
jgi:hypothetical protein